VQLLVDIGASIYGAVFPVTIADLMRGAGRLNVAQDHGSGNLCALSTRSRGWL
jgi:hypothetical protein